MTEREQQPAVDTTRGYVLALLLVVAIVAAVALRYRPPSPRPITAPPTEFSAARALIALRDVLGDGRPHPLGSAANAAVRDRILAQLKALGYEPAIQRGFACDEFGDCGAVENIVARLPGREPGAAVVLAAHYDSVAAGPGASDDGAGVASLLEIARILRQRTAPRHAVILLVTDGEETGLLGARVFVDEHPWAQDVRAAVNLEARGTSGPSFLFETGSQNRWAMRLYDGLVARPITNSIFYTAYKLLPNDTDYTVFKTRDWQGYNFAYTGDVQRYHTPLDDIAYVSPASLQQHGENALATLVALANAELPAAASAGRQPASEAVYFDLFATRLLRWPVMAALPAALLSALLLFGLLRLMWRRQRLALRALAWGLLGVPSALALALFSSAALLHGLRLVGALPPRAAGYGWIAQPLALELANAALAVLALTSLSSLVKRQAGYWGLWAAIAVLVQLAGLLAALLLPGLSFALLLPGLAMLAAALPALRAGGDRAITRALAALVPLAVSLSVLLPTLWFLYETLGANLLPGIALLAVWMLAPLLPLLATASRRARRGTLVLSVFAVAVATLFAALQPVYTLESPQRLNYEYRLDADRGSAEWLASPDSGRLPAAVQAIAPFVPRQSPPYPWRRGSTYTAPAPAHELAAPALEVLASEAQGETTHYRVKLVSARGARTAGVCFAPDAGLRDEIVAGYRLPPETARTGAIVATRRQGWRCLTVHTLAAGGVELQFAVTAARPVEVLLFDRSEGLPEDGGRLLEARPDNATASQDGDVTRVVRQLPLPAPPHA